MRDLLYRSKAPVVPVAKLRSVIEEVFKKMSRAHSRCKVEQGVQWRKFVGRYLRNDKARNRVRSVLGARADSRKIYFLGAEIDNPLIYLDDLPARMDVPVAPVHGDLHPDNVIVDHNDLPHLIDFAWAKKRENLLVDFVLLESSIRFMAFPRPINLEDQLRVDRALIDEDGYKRVRTLHFPKAMHQNDYARMSCAVEAIRERARGFLGDKFSMEQYLFTQMIVLYGLLRYDQYDPYVSIRALGLIATHLRKVRFPN